MAEVTIVKQPKQEKPEITRWTGLESPLFRGTCSR